MATIWRLCLKKIIIPFSALFVSWLLTISTVSHSSSLFEVFAPNIDPKFACDYVADINHMWATSPELADFKIIADGGRHPTWKYTAILEENVPSYGLVQRKAEFTVQPVGSEQFEILSSSVFCKFYFFCVVSENTLTFSPAEENVVKGTKMTDRFTVHMSPMLNFIYGHHPLLMFNHGILNRIAVELKKQKMPSPRKV